MRVLFITNTFPPAYTGGAEVANYHTCRGLIRRGVDCSILFINSRIRRPANEWYELDGIPVHRVNFDTYWRTAWRDVFDWRVYRTVSRALRRLKPDLVHIHNVSGATLAPHLACRMAGVPVVNTLHDMWLLCPNNMLYQADGSYCDPRQHPEGCGNCFRRYDHWGDIPYRRTIFARLTSNVARFISPSQALIDRHVEAGYARQRFRLVRLGFEERVPEEPNHPGIRSITYTAPQHRTIVFAGGGVEIKGAVVLLQAIPLLVGHVDCIRIVVAGGGEDGLLAQFRQFAPAVQVLGRVPFTEMRALFAAADLTILPSVWHENSPVVIYENLQAGTPIVGSAIGGIPELIDEGETGYLFPNGDASALAAKVIHHLNRPAYERRRMRQNCVMKARTHLTLENHLDGVLQVYQEVLGN